MAAVEQLRFAQLLKRVFGTRVSDPGRILLPQVSGTVELQDAYQPENRTNRGEKLWGIATELSIGNVAPQQALQLNNPNASNRVIILRRCIITGAHPGTAVQGAATLSAFIGRPNLAQPTFGIAVNPRDSRLQTLTPATPQLTTSYTIFDNGTQSRATNAQISIRFAAIDIPSAAAQPLPIVDWDTIDLVLYPGGFATIAVSASAVPTAAWKYYLSIEGYERIIDPTELSAVA